MSVIEKLKAEAAVLEVRARAAGQSLKHCAALEQVAKSHGYESWRACLAARSGEAPAARPAERAAAPPHEIEMKHYTSREWNFSLDVPKRWNAFPPVPTGENPFEIIRFASLEDGYHMLIIFRIPCDPTMLPQASGATLQQHLIKAGFANFVLNTETVEGRIEFILDCEQQRDDRRYGMRYYSFVGETLGYRLAFTSPKWGALLPLFDRMAKSFEFSEE